jgi:mutator protein MutT
MIRTPVSAVIVESEGKILMLRKSYDPRKGKLDFIGGFMDSGETPEQAAVREAKEEAGVDVKLIAKFGEFEYFERGPKLLHMFAAEIAGGKVTGSKEGEPVWVELDSLIPDRDMTFPQHEQVIEAYKKYRELPSSPSA